MCHSFTIASYQELERTLRELATEGGFSTRFTIARNIVRNADAGAAYAVASRHEGPEEAYLAFDATKGGSAENDLQAQRDGRSVAVAYPGSFAPVILAGESGTTDGQQKLFELHADLFGFGWPVEWKKGTVFNARLDSLLKGGGMWGNAIETRRCVVPCDSFFESHMKETVPSPRTGKPTKRRYVFSSPDGRPLLLAAVYDGEFFSIVTTDSDPQVSSIHDRMPLVLSWEDACKWLDPATSFNDISALSTHCDRGNSERLLIEPLGDVRSQPRLF